MKEGAFSDRTIHLDGEVGPMEGEHVGLHGGEQVWGRVRKLGKDGLAANHHDVSLVRDAASCANDMLKLGSIHTP
jgi:hypothetical protein